MTITDFLLVIVLVPTILVASFYGAAFFVAIVETMYNTFRKANRFKVMVAMWTSVLAFCTLTNYGPYFNVVVILSSLALLLFGIGYVCDDMNEKEQTFFNNLTKKFN